MLAAIVIWMIVALFALLVLVLVTPVRVRAQLRSAQHWHVRVDAWLLGGLSPRLPLVDSRRPRKPRMRQPKPKRKTKNHAAPQGMAKALPRLIKELLQVVHLEELRLDAGFGLPDPADTGQLYGCLLPLQYAGFLPRQASIFLRPDFSGRSFDCEIDGTARFTAAAMIPPAIRFGWRAFGPGR